MKYIIKYIVKSDISDTPEEYTSGPYSTQEVEQHAKDISSYENVYNIRILSEE